jgi:hypothetical protein
MRSLTPLLLLLLTSCGQTQIGIGSSFVGELRSVGPSTLLSTEDRARLGSICNAFAQKELILESIVGTTHPHTISQKDCSGNTVYSGDVNAVLQKNGTSYLFRRSDGADFIFPEIDTRNTGAFNQICSQLNTITNPIINGSEALYVTTIGISPENCSAVSGEICVQFVRGNLEGSQVRILTKEWARFRVNSTNGRIGFFTQRTKISRSYCGQNEAIELKASLK